MLKDMTMREFVSTLAGQSEDDSEKMMRAANDSYRSGNPTLSDGAYDALMEILKKKFPHNTFFNQEEVEPEPELIEGKTVKLPARMLSTNKAYSLKEIEKWADDVVAVGKSLGMANSDIFFRITPKLDGFAAYDDGQRLYTRGDGRSGTDITRAFDRGLRPAFGYRGKGPGEIVVDKALFKQELAGDYENSRNVIAAVIKEGTLDEKIRLAIAMDAITFQPFSELNGWMRNKGDLIADLEALWELNFLITKFDTDGLVIEAVNSAIKSEMGHTNHHHKWQIAYKKNTEYHDIKVTSLVWQTSKNGRLTPVVQLEPTKVSGVTISKATGHHYGNVFNNLIDTGAVVRVCRSGLVIPYIESVVKGAEHDFVSVPTECPSCGSPTEIDGDNLLCTNTETCPAQIEGMIEFFFKTLGNCDGFGPVVIGRICSYGITSIEGIYDMRVSDYIEAGFGEKTANNLVDEINASVARPIEDWRFLAAFSIHNVGKGGCEKLLSHHRLKDVFALTAEDIIKIDGFAKKTANSLVASLKRIKPQFDAMMQMYFDLIETPLLSEKSMASPIAGLVIVFTGSMQHGKRSDMEAEARRLGAKVSGSVSGNTDYLVCGQNVGAAKTKAAENNGTRVLSEDEYLELIRGAA